MVRGELCNSRSCSNLATQQVGYLIVVIIVVVVVVVAVGWIHPKPTACMAGYGVVVGGVWIHSSLLLARLGTVVLIG